MSRSPPHPPLPTSLPPCLPPPQPSSHPLINPTPASPPHPHQPLTNLGSSKALSSSGLTESVTRSTEAKLQEATALLEKLRGARVQSLFEHTHGKPAKGAAYQLAAQKSAKAAEEVQHHIARRPNS